MGHEDETVPHFKTTNLDNLSYNACQQNVASYAVVHWICYVLQRIILVYSTTTSIYNISYQHEMKMKGANMCWSNWPHPIHQLTQSVMYNVINKSTTIHLLLCLFKAMLSNGIIMLWYKCIYMLISVSFFSQAYTMYKGNTQQINLV